MGISGFVDIHCHVLPGLDDGPRDPESSARLLEAARMSGCAAIVATPHCSDRYRLDLEQRDAAFSELERAAAQPPELFIGCELELTDEGLSRFFDSPNRFSINGGHYVLVELPFQAGGAGLGRILRLFGAEGYVPILAHPERYPHLAPDAAGLQEWAKGGGLLQLTAASLTGRMGKRAHASSLELLRRGLAHFVASDAHDAAKRGPDMRDAFGVAADLLGVPAAGRLFTTNPLAALRNAPLLG